MCLQDAIPFQSRQFIEPDMIDVRSIDARRCKSPIESPMREGGVILNSRKSFFTRGRDDRAIVQQRYRRIMVVR